jgi:hypothetical protein
LALDYALGYASLSVRRRPEYQALATKRRARGANAVGGGAKWRPTSEYRVDNSCRQGPGVTCAATMAVFALA